MIDRAYKCRLYPNKEQVELIEKTFGACRWVWNKSLEAKSVEWHDRHVNVSAYELMKLLTKVKQVVPWLNEVDSQAMQQSVRDLDQAFKNFFRRVKNGEKPGYPKWKRKSDGTQSYRTPAANGKVRIVDDRHLKLPKLGIVRCRMSQPIEGRILNATVKRVPSGKYYAIICCADVPEPEMPLGENEILGIDAGVHDLMTRSDGVKVPNGKHLKASEKRLARAQRKLSRRKGYRKGERKSANFLKQQRKVARLHERIANQRRDAIHKATTDAVRDSQAVAVEDLNVNGMVKNHKSAKSTLDASMSEMIRQLEYKCAWYGRDFVKVDTFFPSTQICGNCGSIAGPKGFAGLKRRTWDCPECGAHHDRDLNAARNIAREGERLLCE